MKKYILVFCVYLSVCLPSHAEWNLQKLWTQPMKASFIFDLSPNDSSIFASTWYDQGPNTTIRFIKKLNIKNGYIYDIIPNKDTITSIKFSKGGSYLSASGNRYMGFIDTNKLEYFTKIEFPNIINHHYNESKGIMTGYSFNTIKQYDTKTKTLIKEYDSSYFKIKDIELTGVALPNIEDRFIYSFKYFVYTGPKPGDGDGYSCVRIINNEGTILFEKINKNIYTDSRLFTMSNDGTKIAYFYLESNTIKIAILDILTQKILCDFNAGQIPNNLMFSRDDKYLYNGNDESLIQIDIANLKSTLVRSHGSYEGYKINSNTSTIFIQFGSSIEAFKIDSQLSVISDLVKNKFKLLSSPSSESLQIDFQLSNNYLVHMRIYNSNGRLINEIENKNYNLGEYTKNYNIQNLPSGAYFIQIKLNNEIYPQTIKFIKVN